MTAERWQQVSRIYHDALARDPQAREGFVRDACGGDEAMQKEVQSLLAQPISAENFLGQPAATTAVSPPPDPGASLLNQRLGTCQILEVVGVGGMGIVYRARDTKLGRDVAIKVLPRSLSLDPKRLTRFEREARLLAALNHPHVAAIYGIEDADGVPALVLEFVEGPTLAERVTRGAVPMKEALEIARQIAEALDAAHERGIVHRDLKPGNVKIKPDGTVKVLDFGLAKATAAETPDQDRLNTPITAETQQGLILGTPSYMSPEQARTQPVDKRTDIWAFGCVLYEMLTGEMAFHGDTIAETLAAVIRAEPDWTRLPPATPSAVCALLRRCLQKDVRQRLQSIGDGRIALEEILAGAPMPGERAQPAKGSRVWLAAGLTGGVLGAILGGFAVWQLARPPALPHPMTRFTIALPHGQQLATLDYPTLALSADGSQLAYVATSTGAHGTPQIYLRAMDGTEVRPLAGTEGGAGPFFSPDGRWLGFFADGKLKKIPTAGGAAQTLADARSPQGASWGANHTIAFALYASTVHGVSDAGGAPRPLTQLRSGETLHHWPVFLPDGKSVLFAAASIGGSVIAVQPIGASERRDVVPQAQVGANGAQYAVSGHLVYAQAGNLMAVPFDLRHLATVTGVPAVPVLPGVLQYSLSATGSLVYAAGPAPTLESRLVWVSRKGSVQALAAAPGFYTQPRLSPDGRRVALDRFDTAERLQVWLYDLGRDTLTPFTFGSENRHPVWTADSKRIVFMSFKDGANRIFSQLADGTGALEQLTHDPSTTTADILHIPYSVSRDGVLTFVKVVPTRQAEFWSLHVSPSTGSGQSQEPERFLETSSADGAPQLSPDGHWLAYASDEPNRGREIYVRAFPGPGGPWQVSNDGGNEPQWNPRGGELFYRSGHRMMAVDIGTAGGFAVGKPHELFEGNFLTTFSPWVRANYDVSADGQRFLMLEPVQSHAPITQINVVLNWSEELKRLVPAR